MKSKKSNEKLTRRNFIKTGLFGTGVLINTGKYFQVKGKNADTRDIKMKYRILGRTGLKVSEIGLGRLEMQNENTLEYALDRGINYIDTPHEYLPGEDQRSHLLQTTTDGLKVIESALPAWRMAQDRVKSMIGEEGAQALTSVADSLWAQRGAPGR